MHVEMSGQENVEKNQFESIQELNQSLEWINGGQYRRDSTAEIRGAVGLSVSGCMYMFCR